MTRKFVLMAAVLSLFVGLSGCGRGDIRDDCAEAKPYQSVVAGKRIVVPEGLDSLESFKEMPVPKAETAPRPDGARCIESPPAVKKAEG